MMGEEKKIKVEEVENCHEFDGLLGRGFGFYKITRLGSRWCSN